MAKMHTRCKVCQSPHRIEFERKRIEKDWTLEELSNYAKDEYDEKISINSFSGHFRKHMEERLKEKHKVERQEKEMEAKKQLSETVDVIRELRGNVKMLKKILKSKLEGNTQDMEPSEINSIRSCLKEIRESLETMSGLTDDLQIRTSTTETDKEEFINRVKKLPVEDAEKILDIIEEEE